MNDVHREMKNVNGIMKNVHREKKIVNGGKTEKKM